MGMSTTLQKASKRRKLPSLSEARRDAQLTQSELAARAGLGHPSEVSRIESGLRPGESVATRITDVLGPVRFS